MATTTPYLRRRSLAHSAILPAWTAKAALGAAVLIGEIVLAVALASGRLTMLVWASAGAVALLFAFAFPMATAVLLLVAAASAFHGDWFAFAVGPLNTDAGEMMLVMLLVVAAVQPRRRTLGGVAGAALGVFLALLGIAMAASVGAGDIGLNGSLAWGRAFAMFAFFYVVVRLFPDARSRRLLLGWAAGIAAATGAVGLIVALGAGLGATLQDPAQQMIRAQEGLGILQRVRLPGLSLAYALFWYAVVRAVQERGGRRMAWLLAVAGFAASMAVSFNRNMWLGLAVGLLAMLALSDVAVRRRLAAAAVGVALLLAVAGSDMGAESSLSPLIERGTSLTDPSGLLAESSLRARENELARAWSVAQENLAIGIGPGVEFGVFFNEAQPGGSFRRVPQLFLHNQYLYLMLIAGLPALAAFLTFLVASLRTAWRVGPGSPSSVACGVGLATIMLSALVALYFSSDDMILAIALLAGVLRGTQEEADDAGASTEVAV